MALTALALLTGSCGTTAPSTSGDTVTPPDLPAAATASLSTAAAPAAAVTRPVRPPRRVVVLVLENHSKSQIIGNGQAPYLNRLAARGALYTRSYAITHPSQPNYLVLFAGSTLGVSDNSCPNRLTARSLGSQRLAAGHSFAGYAEGLPRQGWTGCTAGAYARKHVPWVNFTNLPASVNRPLTAFPTRFAALPRLSFVIPDLDNDMHDGSIATGDRWVRDHLGAYARWAKRHDSLLVVTFDEDDTHADNQIATIAYGARVRRGAHPTRIDHCRVLATLEGLYRLAPLGCAAGKPPIRTMWHR